jgi:hypothetical protein
LPEGFDASGVEIGYFAPTNKDNNVGAAKMEYLTGEGEQITRPVFGPKPRKNTKNVGRPQQLNENGGPSNYVKVRLGKDFNLDLLRPKDLFDLQLSKDYFQNTLLKCTNARAVAEGAGGEEYKDFVPFDLKEIYKFNALLFANAVSLKPQFGGSDHTRSLGMTAFCLSLIRKS